MQNNYILGIDCGGTNIRMGLVDKSLKIFEHLNKKANLHAKELTKLINDYVLKHQDKYNIKAISIGFPGIVDNKLKKVIHTPNLRDFEKNDFLSLEKKLNIPIYLANDTNLLLLYDAFHFKIEKDQSVLGFYLGTGFGNAIKLKDKLYLGDSGISGEIGHVPAYLNGIDFEKETQEDLETFVSGHTLIKIHEKHFKDTAFEEIFIKHLDSPVIKNFLYMLAFYIVTEITILDVHTIILGGGVITSRQFPKDYLFNIIKRNLYSKKTKENIRVYFADSDQNSGILGAYLYALEELGSI